MRICVYGAGAGGGHFAVKLALGGHDVSVVARGAHLEAMQQSGSLVLQTGERTLSAPVRATGDPASLEAQDLVIVGVKSTALPGLAEPLRALIGPETLVLFPQNGMPWWYSVGLQPTRRTPPDIPILRLAPQFLAYLHPRQILGGSIYSANEVSAPGVVRNTSPGHNRVDFAYVAEGDADRLDRLRVVFREAGIESRDIEDIRETVWAKLLANISGSLIALVTGNRSSVARRDPALGELYLRIVEEGLAIAEAYGFDLRRKVDPQRMLGALLDHKPSMLQDYEGNRPMEIAEIVVAPIAFARAAGVATPTLDAVGAIATRLAVDRGLFVSPDRAAT